MAKHYPDEPTLGQICGDEPARLANIGYLIARGIGAKTAMAVQAAIIIAQREWTDDDTIEFGTVSRDELNTIQH